MPEVIGAIRDKWIALGGSAGVLGEPLDIERPTFDGTGRAEEFTGGTVSWHPKTGAFAVWGAIRERWIALGREGYGYPVTDESGCPDGRGRFNHFRAMQLPGTPDASIYWTPTTDAQPVYGAIRDLWARHGWEKSPVGYPLEAEHDPIGGSDQVQRLQRFEVGEIDWHPSIGAWYDLGSQPTQLDFDFPSITFDGGVPVGGFAHLTLFSDGTVKFTGHFHDSGATEYNMAAVAAVKDDAGWAYTAQHQGHVSGTFESGSRDDDWNGESHNNDVAKHWPVLAMGPNSAQLKAHAGGDLVGLTNSVIGSLGLVVGVIALL